MTMREMQLSEEQEAQMRDIREAYRASLAALRTQHENGAIDRDTFRERSRTLRDGAREDARAVLTDEQRERADRLRSNSRSRARNDRARRAQPGSMSDALGLNSEQEEAMQIHAALRSLTASNRIASSRTYRRPPR